MKPPVMEEYDETTETEPITSTEWWCPTLQRWTMCTDVCPDGTPHTQAREVTVVGTVWVNRITGIRMIRASGLVDNTPPVIEEGFED